MNAQLVENLERPTIRALAEKHSAELSQAAKVGKNVHQVSLDQSDRVRAFGDTLDIEDRTTFYTILAEEMNACAKKTEAETAVATAENIKAEAQAQYVVGIIGFLVIFGLLYYFVFGQG